MSVRCHCRSIARILTLALILYATGCCCPTPNNITDFFSTEKRPFLRELEIKEEMLVRLDRARDSGDDDLVETIFMAFEKVDSFKKRRDSVEWLEANDVGKTDDELKQNPLLRNE